MSEDYEGTPSQDEAPDASNDDLSPTLDDDTPVRDSEPRSVTDDSATLRAEVEELRKRVSGQTMSWQQERAARTQLEQRIERWKQAGVDPDEIDRAIAQTTAQTQQPVPQGLSQAQLDQHLAVRDLLKEWEYEKDKYFDKNSDDDTPQFRRFIDSVAVELTNAEIREYGRIISNPKQVAKKATEELTKFKNHIEKKVAKQTSETRTKVQGQAVTDTAHRKPKPAESDEDKPMSNEDYVALYRNHSRRVREKR